MLDLTRRIEDAGFEEIRRAYLKDSSPSRKYLNLSRYVEQTATHVDRLGLLGAPPIRALDLGAGTGMLLYILRSLGHDVLALDLDNDPIYNDMIEFLGIPRVVERIERFKPLPDFGDPFDLITAFSIGFDCHGQDVDEEVWLVAEWKFFIDDSMNRLNPGGRLYLNFNPASKADYDFIPDEVAEMLRSLPESSLSPSREFFLLTKPCV